jgi:hypothetical protein
MADFPIYEFKSISGKTFTPEVQEKVDYVMSRVLFLYPDKVIEGLNKNYRKFAENTVLAARRLSGYETNDEFFEDFGFVYVNKNKIAQAQKETKSGILDFVKNDSVLNEYYKGSLYPNILVSNINIYSKEFEELFNKKVAETGVTYAINDFIKEVNASVFKDLTKFTDKEKQVSIKRCLPGKLLNERLSMEKF